jgi:DNA-binding NarL/FixJ family response regulator
MAPPYLILLADDHRLLRREMKKIITAIPDLKLVGEAKGVPDLWKLLETEAPDLLILDVSLPPLRGMEAIKISKRTHPGTKVLLMILDNDKEYLTHALMAGADGVMLKQDADMELPRAIDQIRRGKIYLPPPWEYAGRSCHSSLGLEELVALN